MRPKEIKILLGIILFLLVFFSVLGNTLKQKSTEAQQFTIINAAVEPYKVRPGDTMAVYADIRDASGVSKVTADMGGIETINLSLKKGTVYSGTWYAQWHVHDTEAREYNTTVTAVNFPGETFSMTVAWSDPSWSTSGGDHMGNSWYPATDNASQSISGYH